jgi:hypothetical protein
MDNTRPDLPDEELEPKPGEQPESPQESQPSTQAESGGYVNENITQAFDRLKMWFADVKARYHGSPRLQKFVYQGRFMPAFWTVTAIFSLLVNIIFIAILIIFGNSFFELKKTVADGLVTGISNNLELMDQAHIVTTVLVETTVQLQDNLPVVFNLPINQSTQLSITEDIRVPGATIYLNNTPVLTDLTLPAGTPIQVNFDMTIPVSESIPVDITVPVSLMVPLDVAVDQTDLHQSIVGLQSVIEPYKVVLGTEFNSKEDFPLCNQWWSGWLCLIVFGNH